MTTHPPRPGPDTPPADALPTWAAMSDLDQGAALVHLRACDDEGAAYAAEHYPPTYFHDPALTALDEEAASAHAKGLFGDRDPFDELGEDLYYRLYDAADKAESARYYEQHVRRGGA